LRKITLHDPEFAHPVNMSWDGSSLDTVIQDWNETCAQAVELFGLPGDRYITDLTAGYVTWIFREPQDALLFRLKFAEQL